MFNERLPTNEESKKTVNYLKIMSLTFLILGIMKIKLIDYFIQDLISSLILFCASYQINYCLLVFFCLLAIFNMINYINYFGVILSLQKQTEDSYFTIVKGITFGFYIFSLFIAFYSYKNFKKITMNGDTNIPLSNTQQNQNNYSNNNDNENKFNAFQGKGIKL